MTAEGATFECHALGAGHGAVRAVRNLDLSARAGTVVALLGPNGAGKTTSLLTMAGLLPRLAGEVRVQGRLLRSGDAVGANRAGVVLVPDDRALFPEATVAEHLVLATRRSGLDPRTALDTFPALESRWDVAAGALSGGEQQILAVARGMLQRPLVLLIDEMSMGLAPVVVEQLLPAVRSIADTQGAVVVLVEQHVELALALADDAVVLVHGDVMLRGAASALAEDRPALEEAYLGGRPQDSAP